MHERRCNGIVMNGKSPPAGKMPLEKQSHWHDSRVSLCQVREEAFHSGGLHESPQSAGRVADIFERVEYASRGEH
jgi:hypothetical protein